MSTEEDNLYNEGARTQNYFTGQYVAETMHYYESPDPEKEDNSCNYCQAILDVSGVDNPEAGIVCKACKEVNYLVPKYRKRAFGQYMNLKNESRDDYEFFIARIEQCLSEQNRQSTEHALSFAEQAIQLSRRTPDAYIYKALCKYYLAMPRRKLMENSGREVKLPLDDAKEIKAEYQFYKTISNVIAGRYFRALNYSIERIVESRRSGKIDDKIQRDLLLHIRQFAVCYEISDNPLFLKRELEFLTGNGSFQFSLLNLQMPATTAKFDLADLPSLRAIGDLLDTGQFKFKMPALEGYRDYNPRNLGHQEWLTEKIARLRSLAPGWQPPPLKCNTPLAMQPITIEDAKEVIRQHINQLEAAELKRNAELAARRREEQRRAEELQRIEYQRIRAAAQTKIFTNVLILISAALGIYVVYLLFTWIYHWFSNTAFTFGQFLVVLLETPLVVMALIIGILLAGLGWIIQSLVQWIFNKEWDIAAGIFDWAWRDVMLDWYWRSHQGFYIFLSLLLWMAIIKLINYIKSR